MTTRLGSHSQASEHGGGGGEQLGGEPGAERRRGTELGVLDLGLSSGAGCTGGLRNLWQTRGSLGKLAKFWGEGAEGRGDQNTWVWVGGLFTTKHTPPASSFFFADLGVFRLTTPPFFSFPI